jgi:hypothetical protein
MSGIAKSRQILISPRVLMAVEDAVKVEQWRVEGIRRPFVCTRLTSCAKSDVRTNCS